MSAFGITNQTFACTCPMVHLMFIIHRVALYQHPHAITIIISVIEVVQLQWIRMEERCMIMTGTKVYSIMHAMQWTSKRLSSGLPYNQLSSAVRLKPLLPVCIALQLRGNKFQCQFIYIKWSILYQIQESKQQASSVFEIKVCRGFTRDWARIFRVVGTSISHASKHCVGNKAYYYQTQLFQSLGFKALSFKCVLMSGQSRSFTRHLVTVLLYTMTP